jgi:DNA polymerase III gamma/tau subunit
MRWADYYGHKRIIHNLLRRITHNSKFTPNSFYVSGETGTGKTALVNLMIRSYICEDPQDYTLDGVLYEKVDPCGKCQTCKSILDFRDAASNYTNIKLVQKGKGDDMTPEKQVKEALQLCKVPPTMFNNRKAYRFIIFDEWQTIHKGLRQDVLLQVEASPAYTLFFFITMAEEELGERSRTALASRGVEVHLKGLLPDEIEDFLLNKVSNKVPDGYPKLQPAEAKVIALKSKYSLRQAISYYASVAPYDMGCEYIRPATIKYFLSYADAQDRLPLWEAVRLGKWFEVDELLNKLGKIYDPANFKQLGLDLISDIQRAIKRRAGTIEDQLLAIDYLMRYVQHSRSIILSDYLAMFNHLDLGIKADEED